MYTHRMNSISEDYFRSLAAELKSKFKRVNNFTSHTGSIGNYHEQALKSVIQQLLPSRFSLKTGFVYYDQQNVSKQVDILIIDENEPTSYFLQDGDFAIVHPDAVVAAIEVKTKLNKKDLSLASENLASVINVCSNRNYKNKSFTVTFIFAYSAPHFSPQGLGKFFENCQIQPFNRYPMVIFVENNYFLQMLGKDGSNIPRGLHPVRMFGITQEEENLLHISLFLFSIRKACEHHSDKANSNPFNYSLIEHFNGITTGRQYFKFGENYLEY